MPRGVYDRSKSTMPSPDLTVGSVPPLPDPPGIPIQALADDELPNLIVPLNVTPVIDLNRPEDAPDMADGEWSKRHLLQFLARQPRSMVFIPKENWEAKGEDTFQTVGLQGHWFRVRKGHPESVPIQIATIIEQSQEDFPTSQARLRKRELTDIRDLPPSSDSRGMPGVEVHV